MVYELQKIFAIVVKMTTICTLIAVVSVHQWNFFEIDVKNAFLNDDFQNEVCTVPPPDVSHN